MRFFNAKFYKNLIGIYLVSLGCLGYHTMISAIPDQVFLREGEKLSFECHLPVQFAVVPEGLSRQEVMADISASTYDAIQNRSGEYHDTLTVGNYEVMCYLFGILPIKEVEVSVVEAQNLYAAGRVVGIYGATQGVLVLESSPVETVDGTYTQPAENLVFSGDYIVAVNGEPVVRKEDLILYVSEYGEDPLVLSLWRQDELIDVSVQAAEVLAREDSVSGTDYMLGLWVKDDMAGIGTLTYYDEEGSFGALGHGIGDGQTGQLLRVGKGTLFESDVLGIIRGRRGAPGELQGVVHYGAEHELGEVKFNTDIGIYGSLNSSFLERYKKEDTLYPVGYKQDVSTGDAVILSNASGEIREYHIVIDSLDYSGNDQNKGIRFHVDDEELLELTGGIVQGLSGSPMIQNGHLIGAVTHVLVNDPTGGFGIFIENMLEHN